MEPVLFSLEEVFQHYKTAASVDQNSGSASASEISAASRVTDQVKKYADLFVLKYLMETAPIEVTQGFLRLNKSNAQIKDISSLKGVSLKTLLQYFSNGAVNNTLCEHHSQPKNVKAGPRAVSHQVSKRPAHKAAVRGQQDSASHTWDTAPATATEIRDGSTSILGQQGARQDHVKLGTSTHEPKNVRSNNSVRSCKPASGPTSPVSGSCVLSRPTVTAPTPPPTSVHYCTETGTSSTPRSALPAESVTLLTAPSPIVQQLSARPSSTSERSKAQSRQRPKVPRALSAASLMTRPKSAKVPSSSSRSSSASVPSLFSPSVIASDLQELASAQPPSGPGFATDSSSTLPPLSPSRSECRARSTAPLSTSKDHSFRREALPPDARRRSLGGLKRSLLSSLHKPSLRHGSTRPSLVLTKNRASPSQITPGPRMKASHNARSAQSSMSDAAGQLVKPGSLGGSFGTPICPPNSSEAKRITKSTMKSCNGNSQASSRAPSAKDSRIRSTVEVAVSSEPALAACMDVFRTKLYYGWGKIREGFDDLRAHLHPDGSQLDRAVKFILNANIAVRQLNIMMSKCCSAHTLAKLYPAFKTEWTQLKTGYFSFIDDELIKKRWAQLVNKVPISDPRAFLHNLSTISRVNGGIVALRKKNVIGCFLAQDLPDTRFSWDVSQRAIKLLL